MATALPPSGSVHAVGIDAVNPYMGAVHHQISLQQVQQEIRWTEITSRDSSSTAAQWMDFFPDSYTPPSFVLCH